MTKAKRNLGFLIAHLENTDNSKPIIVVHDTPNAICNLVLSYKAIPKIKFIHQSGKKLITQNLTKSDIKSDIVARLKNGVFSTKDKVLLYQLIKVKLPEKLMASINGSKSSNTKKRVAKRKTAGTKRKVK